MVCARPILLLRHPASFLFPAHEQSNELRLVPDDAIPDVIRQCSLVCVAIQPAFFYRQLNAFACQLAEKLNYCFHGTTFCWKSSQTQLSRRKSSFWKWKFWIEKRAHQIELA